MGNSYHNSRSSKPSGFKRRKLLPFFFFLLFQSFRLIFIATVQNEKHNLPYLLNDLKKNHIFCCLLFCCCIQKPTNTKKKLTTTTTKIKYILNVTNKKKD